jgi:hypothetical protein
MHLSADDRTGCAREVYSSVARTVVVDVDFRLSAARRGSPRSPWFSSL